MSIHIITDSSSDIANDEYNNLTILPMTITFDNEQFQDGVTIDHKQFYEKLIESDVLPVTSQIPPFDFEEAIENALKNNDSVIIITVSGKLSGTWQNAAMAAKNYPERVYVVDSENVTVGEHILVEYAHRMIEQGMTAPDIVDELNCIKKKIHLVALLGTLEYLKKGGRISKTAAIAGNILSIKPVIAIKNGEVEILGKARGSKQANNLIAEEIKSSGGIDFSMPYYLGYTGLSTDLIQKYITDNASLWKDKTDTLPIGSVGGTIGTHAGPGAIAVAWVEEK